MIRPILFNSLMVKAILDDRKIQTRRVVSPSNSFFDGQGIKKWPSPINWLHAMVASGTTPFLIVSYLEGTALHRIYSRFDVGDRLWVRETWAQIDNTGLDGKEPEKYIEYKADSDNPYPGDWPPEEAKGNPDAPKWQPSIHMLKEDARIWLKVEGIKVSRLQSLSKQDAFDEGVVTLTPRFIFAGLWDKINAKKGFGWDVNPWVWTIKFSRESK